MDGKRTKSALVDFVQNKDVDLPQLRIAVRGKLGTDVNGAITEILPRMHEYDRKVLREVNIVVKVGRSRKRSARPSRVGDNNYLIELFPPFMKADKGFRTYALAHELAHVLTWTEEDYVPDYLSIDEDIVRIRLAAWGLETPEIRELITQGENSVNT